MGAGEKRKEKRKETICETGLLSQVQMGEGAELRRYRNMLAVSGVGVIIFGIYFVIRTTMDFYLHPEEFSGMFEDISVPRIFVWIAFWVILSVFFVLYFLVWLYVGRSALKEGRGEKKRTLYLVPVLLQILLLIISIISDFREMAVAAGFLEGTANIRNITIVLDLTFLYILAVLLVSAIRCRKIESRLRKKDASG